MTCVILTGCAASAPDRNARHASYVLSQAGERLAKASYVRARVLYVFAHDGQTVERPAALLFGPRNRARIEIGNRYAYYDGRVMGSGGRDTELRASEIAYRECSLIMLVGMELGACTDPFTAARCLGWNWWKHVMSVEETEPVTLTLEQAKPDYRVIIRVGTPPRAASCVVRQADYTLQSFRVVGSYDDEYRPEGLVGVVVKELTFPSHIDPGDFALSSPTIRDDR